MAQCHFNALVGISTDVCMLFQGGYRRPTYATGHTRSMMSTRSASSQLWTRGGGSRNTEGIFSNMTFYTASKPKFNTGFGKDRPNTYSSNSRFSSGFSNSSRPSQPSKPNSRGTSPGVPPAASQGGSRWKPATRSSRSPPPVKNIQSVVSVVHKPNTKSSTEVCIIIVERWAPLSLELESFIMISIYRDFVSLDGELIQFLY